MLKISPLKYWWRTCFLIIYLADLTMTGKISSLHFFCGIRINSGPVCSFSEFLNVGGLVNILYVFGIKFSSAVNPITVLPRSYSTGIHVFEYGFEKWLGLIKNGLTPSFWQLMISPRSENFGINWNGFFMSLLWIVSKKNNSTLFFFKNT